MEILNGLINDFSISFERHKDHKISSPLVDLLKEKNINITNLLSFQLKDLFQSEKLKNTQESFAVSGIYDPEENNFKLDMWSNSEGTKIKDTIDRINKTANLKVVGIRRVF